MKQDIRKLSLEQLSVCFNDFGEKTFRAKQVFEWLWKKSAISFNEMTNLSHDLRGKLDDQFVIKNVVTKTKQQSNDGTVKFGFKLHDNHIVEGVLIPTKSRMTACISSQVGCSLTCKFCATGYMKRERNLDPSEIYDQVVLIANEAMEAFGQPLSNIVYMGMGEPLLNYKNVLESTRLISSDYGLNISNKRITISTAGISKMIEKLGDDNVKFNLALSLHAANDVKRQEIMPINEGNSLKSLETSLNYFYSKTKSKITFEYIVFNDVNDGVEDAQELADFVRKIPSKVNIIEYNPIDFADFENAKEDKFDQFITHLEKQGVTVNVRRSRGKDIDAACGQLAVKNS